MKALILTVVFCCAPVAFSQTVDPEESENSRPAEAQQAQPPAPPTQDQQQRDQQQAKLDSQQAPPQAQRSVLEVQPGGEALKSKDFYERTGYTHPFVRMPKYILSDQKRIWTSPFHTSRSDVKWWLIFGGATAALVAADRHIEKELPNTSAQIHLGQDFSHIGAAYTLVPLGAIAYFAGTKAGSEHFREVGLLTFEALVDTTIVELALKGVTHRSRPLEGDGKGHFWDSKASWYNSSFPSGHTINTMAIASIFAHEYHHTRWPVYAAYAFAGVVSGARLACRNHFPSDVLAGGAMGWFIGDYVYGKRHNPEIDQIKKRTIAQTVFSHVKIGATVQ